MWLLMEFVAIATDLAEFLGAALGFYLLFGIPLLAAGILTAIITFIILKKKDSGGAMVSAKRKESLFVENTI